MKETKILSKDIYKGKVLHIVLDDVLLDNGVETKREIVHHPGGAGILYINEQEEILLVKQYRYAFSGSLWEIPAGKLEVDENPLVAAKRELEEETGYHTDTLAYLGTIYPTVGYSDEKIYLYLCKEAVKTKTAFDEDEDIEFAFFPISTILEWIGMGKIKDSKTICALFYYQNIKKELTE